MKKAGFTLAEVLITLMILGIIAALTIPSLIQNTQKKEQVVQLKKGLSMINQAITMEYALDQEDLANKKSNADFTDLLKQRLAVTNDSTQGNYAYVRTQDGLTYLYKYESSKNCASTMNTVDENNYCFHMVISTLPEGSFEASKAIVSDNFGKAGSLTGYYEFFAGSDRVVPSKNTADVLYAKDATKSGSTTSSEPS